MKFFLSLIFLFVSFFAIGQPCGGSSGGSLPTPSKCFEIVSILVDACDGSNEGQNEMVRLKVGSSPLLVSGFSIPSFVTGNVNWGSGSSNPWRNFCNFNATSLAKITTINNSIVAAGRCGRLIPLNNNQNVPANGELLIITSTDFNPTAQSFANLMDTLYVVLQCSGNTSGHFANQGSSSTRRLILNHTTCSDTVIYNRVNLLMQDQTQGAEDGGAVNFTYTGVASYVNNGCAIPITPITYDAGTANANYCPSATVNLSGAVTGTSCYYWQAKNKTQGSFNDTNILNPVFTISSSTSGNVTLYLRINNQCGTAKDSVSFNVGNAAGAINVGNDTNLCAGTSLGLNPASTLIGTIAWTSTGTGTFSNNSISNPTYTPGLNEVGNTKLMVSVTGSCGVAYDTIALNYIQRPNPNFAIPSGVICKGSSSFLLIPQTSGGTFSGLHLSGNSFNPSVAGSFPIKHLIANSGCADSSTQTVVVTDKANPSFTIPSGTLCAGNNPIILTPATTGGIFSGNGVVGNTFNPAAGGDYPVKYVVGNGGCLDSSTQIINVLPKPIPSFAPSLKQVCEQAPLITLNPLITGGAFTGSSYLNGNNFDPQLAGSYTIVYTITEKGCTDSSKQTIIVDPMPDPSFSISDTLFCSGDAPQSFTAKETGGVFTGTNVSGIQFFPSIPGVSVVKHRIQKGVCADSAELTVRVIETPTASFEYSPLKPIANEAVQFTFTGSSIITDYLWEFGNPALGTSTLQNPTFAFPKASLFLVKLSVLNEICPAEIETELEVYEADTLIIPNVFTPNKDGINDSFGPVGYGIKTYNLLIFNRWGEQLFNSNSLESKWDGQYNGVACAEGVYFFIIEAVSNSGRDYNFNGTLQLLR